MDDIPPNPIQPSPIQPDELDKLGAAFVDGAMIEEEDFGIPKYDHNVQELAPPLVNEKQINDINKYKGLDGCVREPIIIGEYKGRDGRVKERIEKKPSGMVIIQPCWIQATDDQLQRRISTTTAMRTGTRETGMERSTPAPRPPASRRATVAQTPTAM